MQNARVRGAHPPPATQSPSVPRRYFAHYYVVAALAAGAAAQRAVAADGGVSPRALLLLLALCQGLRRLAESRLVERPSARRMGLAVYAGGIFHYLLVPATLWAAGARTWAGPAAAAAHAAGAALFAFGSWKQLALHRILASQRSDGRAYGVPATDWFATITCPHYTAEVLIYAALVGPPLSGLLGTGAGPGSAAGAAAGALLLGWVATNLTINATRHHRWYLLRFPRQRAFLSRRVAILPGVV